MSQIKREKRTRPFTIIDNEFLQNGTLTPASMGVFAHIMSLPDDWNITVEYLENFFKSVGRDYIKTALKGLENAGYLERVKYRESGRFMVDYILHETPHRNGKSATVKESTVTGLPQRKTRHGLSIYKRETDKSVSKDLKRESENTPSKNDILDLAVSLQIDKKIADVFYHWHEVNGWSDKVLNNLSGALQLWAAREFEKPKNNKDLSIDDKWGAFVNG